jgi:hypothetical protein
MCSIVGSFETDKLKELVLLNSYRGSFSHSVSYYDINEHKFSYLQKAFGSPNMDEIEIPTDHYGIVHVQAPTTSQTDTQSIHPSTRWNSLLWHNGILKPKTIEFLQRAYDDTSVWDTGLLHRKLVGPDPMPNDVDGSFSCLWYDDLTDNLFLFRNQISPMFIDINLNISSTKFEGSESTQPDVFLRMDFKNMTTEETFKFETVNNPYFFT